MAFDTSPLSYPKTDKIPIPAYEDPRQYIQSTDWNTLCTVVDSIRETSGSGTIAGTIAATQVAYGSGADTIAGSAGLTWDNATGTLTLDISNAGTIQSDGQLVLNGDTGGAVNLNLDTGTASATLTADSIYLLGNAGLLLDSSGVDMSGAHVTLTASEADGASAIALDVDTTSAWSTSGAKLQRWSTNNVEKASLSRAGEFSANAYYDLTNSYGFSMGGATTAMFGNFVSGVNNTYNLGSVANRWLGTYSNFYEQKMGAQLTAAASITPTTGFHHVTGATTIDTIAVTNFAGNPLLVLVGDGGVITWSAGGNILSAGTIAQDKMQVFIYDLALTKWIPQQ
jgi:hypothetical protein